MQIPNDIEKRITWRPKKTDTQEPRRIAKIEPIATQCDDCGKTVVNRRTVTRKLTTPYDHWRTDCKLCGKIRDPRTGNYDLDEGDFLKYLRSRDK